MKTKVFKISITIVACYIMMGIMISYISCKKDSDSEGGISNDGYVQMEMTDAPGDYKNVYVDIKSVEVHLSDTSNPTGWVTLKTRDGIYDLMALQNDLTVVLADSTMLPKGKITQIRLILGINNRVVLQDLSSHTLTIPSSAQTGIKINVNASVQTNKTTRILIDFDANSSVKMNGLNDYHMNPVIKVKRIRTS
jgi:hypothetical protein